MLQLQKHGTCFEMGTVAQTHFVDSIYYVSVHTLVLGQRKTVDRDSCLNSEKVLNCHQNMKHEPERE